MAEQYFAPQPHSASAPQAFELTWRGRAFRFLTDSGVFSKGELDLGTRTLLEALPMEPRGRLLDLGCGWGAVGVMLSALHPGLQVVMSDVNERAAALARRNLALNGASAQVAQGDGLAAVEGDFDLIALNPPIRAGKQTVYRLFDECAGRLTPSGALYVVIRRQQGADSARRHLGGLFRSVQTVARRGGFHVFRCDGGTEQIV